MAAEKLDVLPVIPLDAFHKDLAFQLKTAEELDWDYFLETAMKAKMAADREEVNHPECERSIEEIIEDAKAS